jgi:hypothetical protein
LTREGYASFTPDTTSFSRTYHKSGNTPGDADSSNDGRKGDAVFFLVLNLDCPEVNVLLRGGISDALINEGENSDDNEDDSGEFHNDYV